MAFGDDFERADGPLGANWTVTSGALAIASGRMVGTTVSGAICNPLTASGDIDVSIIPSLKPTDWCQHAIIIHWGGANGDYVFLRVQVQATGYTVVVLYHVGGGSDHVMATTTVAYDGKLHTFAIRARGNLYSALCDGVIVCQGSDSTHHSGSLVVYQALHGSCSVEAFNTVEYPASSMVVEPNPVWIGGGLVQMTATGTVTGWTIGVPGSTTLTVDHGDISYQYTIDATHIRFTYLPGLWIGTIQFTESQYGLTAEIDVTLTPPSTYPGALTLSAEAIAYIERSAVAESNPTIANREMVVASSVSDSSMLSTLGSVRSSVADYTHTESSEPAVAKLVYLLWQIINGVNAPPTAPLTAPSDTTLKADSDAIQLALATLVTANQWTLGDVITQITGLGVPTIKDVIDALGDLPAPDLSSVLDAIAAVRGDGSPDLRTLADLVEGMRTVSNYTLADVKDWIGTPAQVPADATALAVMALVAALLLAAPTGGASVAAAAVAVGAGPVLDIASIVELISLVGDVAAIASNLAEAKAAIDALAIPQGGPVPPVWVDADHATVGETVALANGLEVVGPLSGVLVVITGHPAGAGVYGFGDMRSWGHAGACAFRSAEGYYEWPISLGPENQLITPRSMQVAGGARFRVGSGYTGTVTPWLASGG
jgi:hypothetical protein